MPRRKKTKEQKILAEIRRKETILEDTYVYSSNTHDKSLPLPSTTILKTSSTANQAINPRSNHLHLISDLRITLVTTGIIIIMQIALMFILNRYL